VYKFLGKNIKMTNVRNRFNKNAGKTTTSSNPSVFQSFTNSMVSLMNKKSGKKDISRIQKMSVIPYILSFIGFLIFSIYFIDYLHYEVENVIAHHNDLYTRLYKDVECSKDYGDKFKGCTPKKCGRVVQDHLFEKQDLDYLVELVKRGMNYGGGNGGATILDLHSGALSYGDKFINIYKMDKIFNSTDFEIYSKIKDIILNTISKEFDVPKNLLHLTKPTFFSRLNNKPPVTDHDEYWHPHIDRVTYGTFYYTSLLYLSEYDVDFTGGRFTFVDEDYEKYVEPRLGRLSYFTSGSENKHYVERVTNGTRYAITVSFTCDKKHAIRDPK